MYNNSVLYDVKRISFAELKEMNGKSIDAIKPHKESGTLALGLIEINGVTVLNCFQNKVSCDNETFAFVHFYDRQSNRVASISVCNVEEESLIIVDGDKVFSETSMRVMFNEFVKLDINL